MKRKRRNNRARHLERMQAKAKLVASDSDEEENTEEFKIGHVGNSQPIALIPQTASPCTSGQLGHATNGKAKATSNDWRNRMKSGYQWKEPNPRDKWKKYKRQGALYDRNGLPTVERLFIALTEEVGEPDEVIVRTIENLAKIKLVKDGLGNYYYDALAGSAEGIGEPASTTMFCAHLDTVAHLRQRVRHKMARTEAGSLLIGSDGNTILGADDRSGITVLLYLIMRKVPGLYVFFRDEESGRIGSEAMANTGLCGTWDITKFERCIAFDRRGYTSVITEQMNEETCSLMFAKALAENLSSTMDLPFMPDDRGSYTDTYSMRGLIPECTNISVGYYDAHCKTEHQNITFLEDLCVACVLVDWDRLPAKRKPAKESRYYNIGNGFGYGLNGDSRVRRYFGALDDDFDENGWLKNAADTDSEDDTLQSILFSMEKRSRIIGSYESYGLTPDDEDRIAATRESEAEESETEESETDPPSFSYGCMGRRAAIETVSNLKDYEVLVKITESFWDDAWNMMLRDPDIMSQMRSLLVDCASSGQ